MKVPISTYRLQLNASFTFKHVAELISYLHELGITTIYASPFFTAAAGSTHGYDVCDPHALNKEIGTPEQLLHITAVLRRNNMTWLQDIVPNHMVFSMANERLADVLERGAYSEYFNWFDIDWMHPDPELHGRLMVPVLGKPLADCLQQQELRLDFDCRGFEIKYKQQAFPLSIGAYEVLLSGLPNDPAFTPVTEMIMQLYSAATCDKSLASWNENKQHVLQASEKEAAAIKLLLLQVNANGQLLQKILQKQYYRLSWWQETNQKINYRRFFAVNELIAINMEDEDVFNEYHSLLFDLYKDNVIHGLRLDHIDGLHDPVEYIHSLRELFGDECYLIVEKILEEGESLPAAWPLQGTTGYEFGAQVNWLLTNPAGAKKMVHYYRSLFPDLPGYKEIIFEKKQSFLEKYMGGEWDNLVRNLYELQLAPAGIDRKTIKQALGLFMCCMPVYRLYPHGGPLEADEQQIIKETVEDALRRAPHLKEPLACLLSIWDIDATDVTINSHRLCFQKRLMQFTGPLTAKGVEDTTFYVYNALLSHNEVGDTPDLDQYSVDHFHRWILQRQQTHPYSLNTTSTHDSKRGEDGRIRLNALTCLVTEWEHQVAAWRQKNNKCKTAWNGAQAPMLQDEYFIYQSLVSGFPENGEVTDEYITRLKDYFIKSVREAKIYTNWQDPDSAYEEAGCRFIEQLLSPQHDFLQSFLPFFNSVLSYAHVFSLTQALIKFTAPGVPDTYQGCEWWNTSYVDPDNRRPVDHALGHTFVQEIKALEAKGSLAVLDHLKNNRTMGAEKFFVTWKALQCRRKYAPVFLLGTYIPLYASVDCGIIAYARQYENQWVLVVAPVSEIAFAGSKSDQLTKVSLPLPDKAPVKWDHLFTGEAISVESNGSSLALHSIIKSFPVALLTGETKIANL
ncbi:malto-oligosyltrehalose synthase [Niastella populi]|uniref:Malto-oligosyltrehalose synthase n=1 Tax=Niastella populi TaxID=550983 RepID=A0A1V9FCN6_9BACT|nr:malto-oligosyltrehalose synthase [Niastella populi]OQP56140.1 malto-oligosyltrehalose synthase [Niastella populi]